MFDKFEKLATRIAFESGAQGCELNALPTVLGVLGRVKGWH